MRLRPVLALLFLCLLVTLVSAARNGAQRSGSRRTSSCKGSSSRTSSSSRSSSRGRGAAPCRPTKTTKTPSKSTSATTRRPVKTTTRKLPPKTPTTKLPIRTTTRRKLPTKTTTTKLHGRTTTRIKLPTKTTTKRKLSPKTTTKLPKTNSTLSSAPPADEESNSGSSTKTSAKKYFQNLKSKLQSAAIWFVENKDKTLDDILVERWKEKCSDTASKKEKRKSCVSAALAEGEDDTPEEKLVKDALKSLLEEDSDEVYEFLSRSSSRTFRDIENEGETNDLGDGTDEDCQPQEGNRRNKRDTEKCWWVEKKKRNQEWAAKILGKVGKDGKRKRKQVTPIEKVMLDFLQRHVMDDKTFEELYQQEDVNKTGIKEVLDLFRQGNDVPKNTIIKRADLENLVDKANREPVEGYWQSKKRIQIIQVEREETAEGETKLTANKYEAHVRFAIDNGNINHMEPPQNKIFVPPPPAAAAAGAALEPNVLK